MRTGGANASQYGGMSRAVSRGARAAREELTVSGGVWHNVGLNP
jgi:hypothetical protein